MRPGAPGTVWIYNIGVQTDTTIVRVAPSGSPRLVTDALWLAFLRARSPLPFTEPGSVKVVHVITLRGPAPPICLELEGAIYPVDEEGFLVPEPAPPARRPLPGNIVDGRHRFFLRRLRHRHGWRPSARLCDEVLRLVRDTR